MSSFRAVLELCPEWYRKIELIRTITADQNMKTEGIVDMLEFFA